MKSFISFIIPDFFKLHFKVLKNKVAIVETFGVKRTVSLDLLEENLSVGDWALVYVGFAIKKMEESHAIETLKLFEGLNNDESSSG